MILLNDDYTPREFVVMLLKAEFGMNEPRRSERVHGAPARRLRGGGVSARCGGNQVRPRLDAARAKGDLMFTTEPEE